MAFERRKGFRRNFGPRQMYKITCSKCNKPGEVPFKPREGMRVLCKQCFFEERGIKPREEKQTKEAKTETEEVEEAEETEESLEEDESE
ncbi:MAG: CxxC-x17-CxxC domain-containing protein [Candidatus Pacearchaeota archaeon]